MILRFYWGFKLKRLLIMTFNGKSEDVSTINFPIYEKLTSMIESNDPPIDVDIDTLGLFINNLPREQAEIIGLLIYYHYAKTNGFDELTSHLSSVSRSRNNNIKTIYGGNTLLKKKSPRFTISMIPEDCLQIIYAYITLIKK